MKPSNIFLGILAAVAAGVVVGILIAPAKGSETRRLIADKANDFVEGLNTNVNEIAENLAMKYGIAPEGANDRFEPDETIVLEYS